MGREDREIAELLRGVVVDKATVTSPLAVAEDLVEFLARLMIQAILRQADQDQQRIRPVHPRLTVR